MNKLELITPKKILILVAGVMWTGVGILLNFFAARWFKLLSFNEIMLAIIGGFVLGMLIAYFGFGPLAQRNIDRIVKYPERVSVFKFQRKNMYFVVIFMISLGIFMRKTDIIPKNLLAPMYIGIGLALFVASFKYHVFLLKKDT